MDQTPTAPDVIEDEAGSSVDRPLARAPLVLNRRNFSWITERISGVIEQPAPRWWWVCFTITATVAMIGLFCLGYQISTGVGTWGLNHPVGWAWDITKMQKNPNVTVRMRGVMEKCTFCVQRIEEAKIAAHVRAGASGNNLKIPRDSFTSACAQACPHEAITFGDIKDPESKVSKMKQQDRNYRLLEYLNVNTRTSYLGRIRNPNPKMPDADNIGVASPGEKA